MSDPVLIAADKLLAAAKFALTKQMHKGSESSVALREAIDAYESACAKDWAELIHAADKACAEQEPMISLELLRERGLL